MNLGGLTNGVKFTSGGGISNSFTLPSATGYTFTFPNATGTIALTSDISYPVTSVFGRTGAVVATSGDYTTAQVTESGNLYFTDSRARLALSFVAGSGAYNSTTGVITIPTNNNQITNGSNYITLGSLSAGTGISYNNTTGVITNSAPDQVVALTASTGISVTGTYPNFTITNTSPSSGGTVTSVAALTIGTTGTDLSSSVANSTTTPVITLNVPTASATNRGALSSADWTTFNNKYNLPSLTSGSVLFSNGSTIAQDNANFFWDDTNNRLGIGTSSPTYDLTLSKSVAAGNVVLNIENTSTTGAARLWFGNNASSTGARIQYFGATHAARPNLFSIGTDIANDMMFETSGTERVRITSGGNVGIGTDSPAGKLTILNGTTYTPSAVGAIGGSVSARLQIQGGESGIMLSSDISPTTGSQTGTQAYQLGLQIGFYNVNDIRNQIYFGNAPLTFVYSGNQGTSVSEYMRIWSSTGNVNIGTTPASDSGYKLDVNGTGRFSGNVQVGGSAISGNSSSFYNTAAETSVGIKQTSGATSLALALWNNDTLADSRFLRFFTEATATYRGSIQYDRPGDRLAIYGGGSGLFFDGVSSFGSLIIGQAGIYQSNASSSIASNKFETYNGGATDMNFSFPASGSVTFTNGTPRLTIASTGAATFSSSVDATKGTFTSAPSLGGEQIRAYSNSGANTSYGGLLVLSSTGKGGYLTSGDNSTTTWYGAQAGYVTLAGTAGAAMKFRVDADDTKGLTIATTGAATFSSTCTATGFFESSDSRLKTLIQDNYQTKGIASITPKLYTKNGKVELGYYAQDFVGILDSAVSKGSDDMLSLSYREVLVAKVYALEQRIKELENK
jgi:hypothetical protein